MITAFGDPKYFSDKYIPANKPGVELKVPQFEAFFDEICKISPLAKQAMTEDKPGGLKAIASSADVYKWKVSEDNPNRLVSHVDKIDGFDKKGEPLLRFRSSMTGPAKKRAELFSDLVSVTEMRQRWDATNAMVDTIYSAADMKEVEQIQDHKYGKVLLFGIGYVKTKKTVVSPREQMTLCGLQEFPSGASITWGVELEEDQDYLFPEGKRSPRSTSHIFSQTLIPTGENTFDVEYCIQLEVGGFPGWLSGPIVVDSIKKMFNFADKYFKSGFEEDGELAKKLALIPDDDSDAAEVEEEEPSDSQDVNILEKCMTFLMPEDYLEATSEESSASVETDTKKEETDVVEETEEIASTSTATTDKVDEQPKKGRKRKRDAFKRLFKSLS